MKSNHDSVTLSVQSLQNMKRLVGIVFIFQILLFLSCSSSHVYSTSLNFPVVPLEKGDFQLNAGAELLPETRPEYANGPTLAPGLGLNLNVASSDKTNLNLRFWMDSSEFDRYGGSFATHVILPLNEDSRVFITPRLAFTADAFEWGQGLGINSTYHRTVNQKFAFYSGLGFAYGTQSFDQGKSGFGVLGNIGISSKRGRGLYFNLEANPIMQFNFWDNDSHLLFNPSIGIGFISKNKKNLE